MGEPAAEIVLPCAGCFEETLAFFVQEFGFVVVRIHPADAPRFAAVRGLGVTLRLDGDSDGPAPTIVIRGDAPAAAPAEAPNGSRVEFEALTPPLRMPPLLSKLVVAPLADDVWITGRAGMRYRDLVPDRQGGRFIASHIRIEAGGPVPDYVHYHRVRFQMIFVRRGWVKVVYEDQGEAFVMHEGDCVLQPPTIRHRVLESSPGLEVVEVSCPAEHETHADPEVELPTRCIDPARRYGGQGFVRHVADAARWGRWRDTRFRARTVGLAAATDGLAEMHVLEGDPGSQLPLNHDGDLLLLYGLAGDARMAAPTLAEDAWAFEADTACVLPPAAEARLLAGTSGVRFLMLQLGGDIVGGYEA